MPVKYNIISPRDIKQQSNDRFGYKLDRRQPIRAVICDELGNDSGSGDIWYDQSKRRVWIRELGTSSASIVFCYSLTPVIGLGVLVGWRPYSNIKEVLGSDIEFLGQTNTTGTSYESPSNLDFLPGGRLQLWLQSKLIQPLATYPSTSGLVVNVVGGDYPYNGQRVTFAGQTNIDLSASQPAAGDYVFVGLYLDSANTLQTIAGASGATTPPAEPAWPTGAFRLSVVRLYNPQAKVNLKLDTDADNDIFDRRMAWSDENFFHDLLSAIHPDTLTGSVVAGDIIIGNATPKWARLAKGTDGHVLTLVAGLPAWAASTGGWPYDKIITVSQTNAGANWATLQDANDNTTGPAIVLPDGGTYTETLTLNSGAIGYSSLGSRGEVTITSTSATTVDITGAGIALRNLTVSNSNAGATATTIQTVEDNTILNNIRILKTASSATTSIGLHVTGGGDSGTTLTDGVISVTAGTTKYGILMDTDTCFLLVDGGQIQGDTYDIRLNNANAFLTLQNDVKFLGGGIQVAAGHIISDEPIVTTITGPYTADTAINGKSPAESIITAVQNTTDTTLTVNAASLTFANWTIQNDGAGGAGITHTVVANAQTGLIMDGCSIVKTTGASTTARGFVSTGGDALLRNCKFNVTAGSTVNYVIYLVTAGSTVVIEGGEIAAGTIVTAHASAVLKLQGPRLGSGVTFDYSGGGIISGFYYDSNGVLRWINTSGVMPLKVKNTSGTTAAVNETGYITYTASSGPEYKTTTTANDKNYPSACVVLVAGANNADIYVATQGEVTLKYSGSAPSAGSFLLFGTTAGQLVASSTMRYELVAVAKAAGASGLVLAQLYTGSKFVPYTSTSNLYQAAAVSSTATAWAGTIATLPGGAVLTYTPTAGNEDTLTNSGTLLAALILHNTTRGTLAYILSTNTGTNTITLTANVPAGWATTDVITIKGQTCTSVAIADALEFEILSTEVPALARAIEFFQFSADTGATSIRTAAHPYEATAASKLSVIANYSTSLSNSFSVSMPLINRRFAFGWLANGAGTQSPLLRMRGYWLATP